MCVLFCIRLELIDLLERVLRRDNRFIQVFRTTMERVTERHRRGLPPLDDLRVVILGPGDDADYATAVLGRLSFSI